LPHQRNGGTKKHVRGIGRQEDTKAYSKDSGFNALQQIERRWNSQHPAYDKGEAALPCHAIAQNGETGPLNHDAACHHQRHGFGRRSHVENEYARNRGERKAGQAGNEGADEDAEAKETIGDQVSHGLYSSSCMAIAHTTAADRI
jgi:hypothetical protein